MKLKIQMRKLLKKNGRMLVREMMEEVAREEQVMHDVFGCVDCFVDPHNGHVSYCVRVEGLLVSVRIHQRKDSRRDRVGGGRVGGGRVRGRRDCPAGYCFGLWGGWNI